MGSLPAMDRAGPSKVAGELVLRVDARLQDVSETLFPPSSQKPDQLRLGGVKIIVHETTGQLSPKQEDLNELVLTIHQSGLQVVVHAIEGKAHRGCLRCH